MTDGPPSSLRIRLPPLWRASLLPVAVTMSITMILLTALEATRTARRLPPEIAFIPVDAQVLAVSSSLDSLWVNFAEHLVRLNTPEPGPFWSDVRDVLRDLSQRCIVFETPGDLVAAGFDTARGLSAAIAGDADLLASFPISDREKALETFEAMFLTPTSFRLSSAIPDADVAAFRVTPLQIENGVLCSVASGAPFSGSPKVLVSPEEIPVDPGTDANGEIELSFAPRSPERARIALSCEAVLRDGMTTPCNCTVASNPCDWPFDTVEHGSGLRQKIGKASPANAGPDHLWESESEWFFGFVANRLLVATTPELVRQAGSRQEGRRARLLGDDTLLSLFDRFYADVEAGEAAVLGLLYGLAEPVAGTLAFALNANSERIELRSALPIDTFRIKVLEQLISTDVDPPPAARVDAPLAALVNDSGFGAYYAAADWLYRGSSPASSPMENDAVEVGELTGPAASPFCDDLPKAAAALRLSDAFGNFAPLMTGLSRLDRIGALQGYLLGVRDGVPEIALVQRGLTRETMETLIRETQSEMKRARDSRILCRARAQFWSDTGGPVFPVHPESLLPYLGDEGPVLLELYNLQFPRVSARDDANFDGAYFDTPRYRADPPAGGIRYLPPPFGANDLRYLLAPDARSEVDGAALQRDAFRLAFTWMSDGAVVFGTDARTVREFLARPPRSVPVAPDRVPYDKLSLDGNPEQLASLALLYPDDAVRSLVTTDGFEVLDQYRSFHLSVRPSTEFVGMVLEMRLGHE